MKDISLKVYNAVKNTGEIKFTTDDDKPTIIKAQKGVNYEFYDHNIDRAPNHIITKRNGKDLHVSFEIKGKDKRLVIMLLSLKILILKGKHWAVIIWLHHFGWVCL